MARWLGRSADRAPAQRPAWLRAPGVNAESAGSGSVPPGWSGSWSGQPGEAPRRTSSGSGWPGDQPRDPVQPGAPRFVAGNVSEQPDRDVAAPAPVSAAPREVAAGPGVAPAPPPPPRPVAGPVASPAPVPPAPIEPLQGGHRFTATGGAQMWIGAAPRPAGVASAPESTASRPPIPVRRSPTNGHHLRVGPPGAGPPVAVAAWRGETHAPGSGRAALERSLAAWDPISDGEAAAFAARFAADYLSFDEDDPSSRAQVMRSYLADPRAATLGWSGVGRQRADIVLPGRTLRTADGTVVVEVTARVIPYLRDAATAPLAEPPPNLPPIPSSTVGPSCAPAPVAPGWVACPALWVRIAPPVRRADTGALVVDLGPAPTRSAPPSTPGPERGSPDDLRAPMSPDPDNASDGGPP